MWSGSRSRRTRNGWPHTQERLRGDVAPVDVCLGRVAHPGWAGASGLGDPVATAFDGETAILHVVDSGLFGDPSRLVRCDAELQPHRLGPDLDRSPNDFGSLLRGAEHVDEIHGFGDILQPTVDGLAEQLLGVG